MPLLLPQERIGQWLGGRYRLEAVLATGGMGVVFGAVDRVSGNDVAVKLMRPGHAAQLSKQQRFLREARTLADIHHPNVVRVLDFGTEDPDTTYLVMERLRGRSLENVLALRDRLPCEALMSMAFPLMGALASVHDRGIVHRDLKPSNIVLDRDGDHGAPTLIDFGVAKSATTRSFATTSSHILGTPAYMAPEQAQGHEVTPQVDVWALGVVLYRGLSGALPFEGRHAMDTLYAITHGPYVPLRERGAPAGRQVAAAIDSALQRDRGLRHASMRDFARVLLEACRADGVPVPQAPDPQGLPDWGDWLEQARRNDATTASSLKPVATGTRSREHVQSANPDGLRRALAVASIVATVALLVAFVRGDAGEPRATVRHMVQPAGEPQPPPTQQSASDSTTPSSDTTQPSPVRHDSGGDRHAPLQIVRVAPLHIQASPRASASRTEPSGSLARGGQKEAAVRRTGAEDENEARDARSADRAESREPVEPAPKLELMPW